MRGVILFINYDATKTIEIICIPCYPIITFVFQPWNLKYVAKMPLKSIQKLGSRLNSDLRGSDVTAMSINLISPEALCTIRAHHTRSDMLFFPLLHIVFITF